MSLFNVFKISGSAMSAQSMRLNTVASNLANADSVVSSDGKPYQSKQVVFKAVQDAANQSSTVEVDRVIEDTKPGKMVYDPKHPMANADGYITMPNVNVTEEMVNMISASRAYQNNVETMNAAKTMLLKTLNIGQ
ncbi:MULTISPECIES: flagellar basal body rod protein FlgC [Methylophilus]|jgi:flagellar basal-body rod protein FlgC|uniref:Flagellar basal-body rod protein FlgC n=1 Tax=Methylophilus medardicus TaxID=2588534 RepID=A0A5B8CSL5_9PROT|nr:MULTISPECIES: flagellar basal body rod protein FlgC [Methylophilus]HWU65930.1 flagellar basal body rod protein FlgC [Methylophilus sp.]AKR43511.1 flagellar basal body rod protein FlgC [Methylophilus sp. TWE2]QDC44314.1 flagellar basal body rod protein FlgC [Methylophilus medardicus]QDC49321.1 flagellar basal body rod protein FlgC [Methylophilus medardicus]QDC53026.1 flagellar basal body rod protein FlgC [Methylophilus medardicus]